MANAPQAVPSLLQMLLKTHEYLRVDLLAVHNPFLFHYSDFLANKEAFTLDVVDMLMDIELEVVGKVA